jgi:hypothetical protein
MTEKDKDKQILKTNTLLGTCLGTSYALKVLIEHMIDGHEVDNDGSLKHTQELADGLELCLSKYNDIID